MFLPHVKWSAWKCAITSSFCTKYQMVCHNTFMVHVIKLRQIYMEMSNNDHHRPKCIMTHISLYMWLIMCIIGHIPVMTDHSSIWSKISTPHIFINNTSMLMLILIRSRITKKETKQNSSNIHLLHNGLLQVTQKY